MTGRRVFHLWRRHLRPYWRDARPAVVVIAGVLVIVLGTIGYLDKHREYGLVDATYRAVGLFGLSGGETPPIPWTLQVARLLGPLLFGYAALAALLRLFRQESRLLAIRLFARDHVVVAGLGEMGFRVATSLYTAGHHVIVIDRLQDNPRIPGVRERGITVLVGDATDGEMLGRAQAGRAAHVIVLCGDDGTNVDVASAAEALAAEKAERTVTALVHLDDEQLWHTLSSAAVGSDQPFFRLEFFNVNVLAAQSLVARRPPFAAGARRPHVLVAGLDGPAEQLVVRLAAEWRAVRARPEDRIRITLSGPGALDRAPALTEGQPGLPGVAEVVATRDLVPPGDPPDCAYVCIAGEATALAAALDLRAATAMRAPVFVAVADEGSGVARALRAEGRALGGIEPFGVLSSALTPDLLRHAETEVLARAKHDEYVRNEARRGITAAENPSLRPWDELPDALKESNRRFADGISAKLAAARCVVVPAPFADPDDPGFAFTDEEVEELAIQEHDRWVRDLVRDGWRATSGEKDAERKLHPLLVPWEELGEVDRDRDREPVREIPAMLARAGFRLVRAESDAAAPPARGG